MDSAAVKEFVSERLKRRGVEGGVADELAKQVVIGTGGGDERDERDRGQGEGEEVRIRWTVMANVMVKEGTGETGVRHG